MSRAVSGSCWRTRLGAASARNSLESVREPRCQRALAVGGDAGDLLLAEGVAEVLERRPVADPGGEQPRAVVGEDRLGALAPPAVGGLADVLEDAEQLHALAGAGRGDLVEVRQRRDVRDLVQGEQQRRVDRLAGPGGVARTRRR